MNEGLIDDNGQRVIAFTGQIRNLARVAELTASVIDMAESGAWRDYRTAVGREQWLAAEFDYFLIACQIERDDVARVLAWNAESAKLAPLMDREAGTDLRRDFAVAAANWHARDGETLLDRGKRLGWFNSAGRLAASPVPPRARTRAATGMSADQLAMTRRAERIAEARRKQIDDLVDTVVRELGDVNERRYFLDRLAARREHGGS